MTSVLDSRIVLRGCCLQGPINGPALSTLSASPVLRTSSTAPVAGSRLPASARSSSPLLSLCPSSPRPSSSPSPSSPLPLPSARWSSGPRTRAAQLHPGSSHCRSRPGPQAGALSVDDAGIRSCAAGQEAPAQTGGLLAAGKDKRARLHKGASLALRVVHLLQEAQVLLRALRNQLCLLLL